MGCGLGIGGFLSDRKLTEQKALEEQPAPEAAAAPELQAASETDYFKDINNVYSLLAVEPIEMEFGYSLIPLVDEKSGGKLISRIVIFRRQYAQDMGFVIPSIRLHDGAALGTNQYVIKIRGEEVARGEILVDYYLALEPSNPAERLTGLRRWSRLRHPLPLDFAGEQGNGGDLRVYGYHTPDRYAYPPVGDESKSMPMSCSTARRPCSLWRI